MPSHDYILIEYNVVISTSLHTLWALQYVEIFGPVTYLLFNVEYACRLYGRLQLYAYPATISNSFPCSGPCFLLLCYAPMRVDKRG